MNVSILDEYKTCSLAASAISKAVETLIHVLSNHVLSESSNMQT